MEECLLSKALSSGLRVQSFDSFGLPKKLVVQNNEFHYDIFILAH
jgi:hypothetical protein